MDKFCPAFLIVASIVLPGCSHQKPGKDWLPTYRTEGYVTVQGEPAVGAIVRLFPTVPQEDTKPPVIPTGVVNEDGLFELTSYSTGDGAPEGEYFITVEWPDPTISTSQSAVPEDPPDRLKHRYSDPKRSKLKASISAEENLLDEISLD
ncbi:carboxypeptidase regulatory-like domain-containing protein [Schlesneria sp. T3-172]|uniref:carboxypeptidase regulatory-like domain-containing protein n=1 Tax=Schlesneria sphaerica TaxID=3373610 RepID=UPI0037C7FD82